MNPVNPYNNAASHMRNWRTIEILAQRALQMLRKSNVTAEEVFFSRNYLGSDIQQVYKLCSHHLSFAVNSSFLRSLTVEKINDLNGDRMYEQVQWRKKLDDDHSST